MYKIILGLLIALSLQGFINVSKYKHQKTTEECKTLKVNSIKFAKKAHNANSYEQATQYKNIADNLYKQNINCVQGVSQRIYGSTTQFSK